MTVKEKPNGLSDFCARGNSTFLKAMFISNLYCYMLPLFSPVRPLKEEDLNKQGGLMQNVVKRRSTCYYDNLATPVKGSFPSGIFISPPHSTVTKMWPVHRAPFLNVFAVPFCKCSWGLWIPLIGCCHSPNLANLFCCVEFKKFGGPWFNRCLFLAVS